jgi:hypothetical protein
MKLKEHLDKKNLHHAYLIEGARDEVVPELLKFLKDIGINSGNNPDFLQITADSFKIDDARKLKSFATEKGFSVQKNAKKIFIISANSFLLEAQNSLLKMFEEPIENTHFFLVVPDVNSLLKTLVSRFYLIRTGQNLIENNDAEKFITMSLKNRIDFIKELLTEKEGESEEGSEVVILDSTRFKALTFLNAVEKILHRKFFLQKNFSDLNPFHHFFKVREFLRMPGSSAKTLMESVALVIPDFKN